MITENIIKILPPILKNKVEENHELRKILTNINWLTFEKFLKIFISVFVFAWVARYLGPEKFGQMNYAIAFVMLFSFLSSLGLENILVREIVAKPDKKSEYLGSAFLASFFGSLLLMFIASIAIFFIEPENFTIQIFVFIIAFAYIFKPFNVIDFWFQSQVQSKYSAYSRSIAFFIVSSFKIVLILTQAPLIFFIFVFASEFLFVAILLIYFYYKKGAIPFKKWEANAKTIKELLKDSWPLMLSSIAMIIYMRIDQIMIGNILGEFQVGLYSAAVKISEVWYVVPNIIVMSTFPSIIRTRENNKEKYLNRFQILYDSFLWFTVIIAFLVSFIAPFIIDLFYGNEYSFSASILSVHIWTGVFVFWGFVNGKYLIAENYTKIVFGITLFGAFINILLNIFLLNYIGVLGAAIATLITQFLTGTLLLLFISKTRLLFKMQMNAFNIFRLLQYLK